MNKRTMITVQTKEHISFAFTMASTTVSFSSFCFRNTDVLVSPQYHLIFHTSDPYMSFPQPTTTIFNFLLEEHLYNLSHKRLKSLC